MADIRDGARPEKEFGCSCGPRHCAKRVFLADLHSPAVVPTPIAVARVHAPSQLS